MFKEVDRLETFLQSGATCATIRSPVASFYQEVFESIDDPPLRHPRCDAGR